MRTPLLLRIFLLAAIATLAVACTAAPAPASPTPAAPTATPSLPVTPPLPTALATASPSARPAASATPQGAPTRPATPAATPSSAPPGAPTATPAASSPGRIAYIENGDIFVLQGGGLARRVTQTGDASSPRWIPKSDRLVFTRGKDAGAELYAINSDGSGEQRLTNNKERDSEPRPSPDGARIAWTRQRDANGDGRFDASEGHEIWLMNSKGENAWRIVTGFDPAWSPDSKRIAYVTNGTYKAVVGARENNELRVIQSQGAEERILAGPGDLPERVELQPGSVFGPGITLLTSPAWSYDGASLAVTARGHTGLVLVADSYRRGVHWLLANYEGGFGQASYSPDGRFLAVESLPASGWPGIKVRDLSNNKDTSIGLPATGLEAGQPRWSPDGRYLLFVGGPPGTPAALRTWDTTTQTMAVASHATQGGAPSDPDWAP